jgi:hypothetical protein
MSLAEWARYSWLVNHEPSAQEIAELLGIADRDLRDCEQTRLSADWRLAIAYNAALQTATAALAASGYRAAREMQHFRVVQSLAFTLGAETTLIAQLDQFRKKRNISDYERAGAVSEKEAGEMATLAKGLRQRVEAWLRAKHPELMSS